MVSTSIGQFSANVMTTFEKSMLKRRKKQSHTLTKVFFVLGTAAQPAFYTDK